MTTRHAVADRCGCGCSTPGCDFPCLSRPRFYCGMVLTDDHLNDLEKYVSQRLALHRYVEGWGVVTGLPLRPHPDRPGSIVVGPGYARARSGDDIVVCEDLVLDVCSCETGGPCCCRGKPVAAKAKDGKTGGAVDVYLVPSQTPADPVVAGGCSCGGHDDVVHERIIDGGALRCVPVDDDRFDPATLAYRTWAEGFAACGAVLAEFSKRVPDPNNPAKVREWLLRWIGRQDEPALEPVRSWLADADRIDDFVEAGGPLAAQALVEIVSALRLAYLDRTFAEGACADDASGVLLGRVWTRPVNGGCRVFCLDAQPPYRRIIGAAGWPRRPGEVNLAPLLWQRGPVADERADERRIQLESVALDMADLGKVTTLLAATPMSVTVRSGVRAFLRNDHCFLNAGKGDLGRVVTWEVTGGGYA